MKNIRPTIATVLFLFGTLLNGGLIFGFNALLPAMISGGIYDNYENQKLSLALMFTIASTFAGLVVLPVGFIHDFVGEKITYSIGLLLLFIGTILFATSDQLFDAYLPGFTLIALSGPFLFVPVLNQQPFPKFNGFYLRFNHIT